MGNGDIHPWTIGQEQVMQSIAHSLRGIENCLQELVKNAREKPKEDKGDG
jgi:hypothetical protein